MTVGRGQRSVVTFQQRADQLQFAAQLSRLPSGRLLWGLLGRVSQAVGGFGTAADIPFKSCQGERLGHLVCLLRVSHNGQQSHGATRLGVSAPGLFPGKDLAPVEGSDGWSADLDANLIVNVSRGLDLTLGVNLPLRGEDLMFFPLEDIHPTRGLTSSATLELRY